MPAAVVRRYGAADLPDSNGDMAVLSCGHYVYAPKAETSDEQNVACGECAAGERGELSAPRVDLDALGQEHPS